MERQTVKQAAERIGVGESTLRKWNEVPEFAEAYKEARRECVDRAISRLEKGFEFAIAVLQKGAGDVNSPPYARVSAARGLYDSSFKAIELHDVTERVRWIEERLLSEPVGVALRTAARRTYQPLHALTPCRCGRHAICAGRELIMRSSRAPG